MQCHTPRETQLGVTPTPSLIVPPPSALPFLSLNARTLPSRRIDKRSTGCQVRAMYALPASRLWSYFSAALPTPIPNAHAGVAPRLRANRIPKPSSRSVRSRNSHPPDMQPVTLPIRLNETRASSCGHSVANSAPTPANGPTMMTFPSSTVPKACTFGSCAREAVGATTTKKASGGCHPTLTCAAQRKSSHTQQDP